MTDDPSGGEGAGPTEDTKTITVQMHGRVRLSPPPAQPHPAAPPAPARAHRARRPHEMARHLVGLQAQENLPPYLSLAARLDDFDPYDVTARPRGPLAGPAPDDARHHPPARRRRRAGAAAVDRAACTSGRSGSARTSAPPATSTGTRSSPRSRELLADGPLPQKALGAALAEHFPGVPPPPSSASSPGRRAAGPGPAARHAGRAAAAWSTSTSTAGSAGRWSSPTCEEIVRRYLRAFGPASAADVTAWSAITRLGPVVKAMDDLVDARGRARQGALRRARAASSPTRTARRRCGCSAATTTSGSPTPAATGSPTPRRGALDGRQRRHARTPSSPTACSSACGGSRTAGSRSLHDPAPAHQAGAVRARRGDHPASNALLLADPLVSPAGQRQRAVRDSSAATAATPAVEVRSTSAPRRTATAPAAAKAATSSSVQPALGADDHHDRPAVGHVDAGQRRGRLLVQHHRQVGAPATGATTSAVDASGVDLGEPGPPGLLGGLAGGGPPAGQRLRGPLALPDGDRARGGPRHDPGDADLGEHLDGELAAVALGQRLDDDDRRLRRGHATRPSDTVTSRRPLAGRGDLAPADVARAVGQDDRLADPQPADGDRVVRLVARRPSTVRPDVRRRPATARGGRGRDIGQCGLNASRSRPKTALACSGLEPRGGLLLAADRGQLAEQLLLARVEPGRRLDRDR